MYEVKKTFYISGRHSNEGVCYEQNKTITRSYYRKISKYLRENKACFHSYSLPEDRKLRVIIRGIPKELDADEVKAGITAQGYPVSSARRIYRPRTKQPFDLVITKLDLTPKGKAIFKPS